MLVASASDEKSLGRIHSISIERSHVSVDWLLQVCQFSSRRAFGFRGYCLDAGWQACVLLAPTWSGESKRGEEVVAGLLRLGTPLFTQLSWMKFQDMLALFDAQLVEGRHYFFADALIGYV